MPKEAIKKIEIPRDNKTSSILINNPESQNCTKQSNIMQYHIWGLVEDGQLEIK